ncbi:DeoR/GlpR family DNA-binding transcription regulator [Paenibacillus pasadenensis]|uniref:Transcriptional regulator of rhamnose utilization, DeoR family n=1 Tax=Paenibacillus pasadenensis TaxID=217090 RepID=A0A2N5N2Q5_9BACL|nr:DeoR/GlpR family DNA-binding transcription regulator [Paenibacillus pasadenensis]PLT44614.1 Transcriptional regulator of rhamnose utilization, DeoR family [Paenibacillus pasadenensis]
MLAAERYEQIVQLVNERGSIRVTELSELCRVTEETIRRDLDRLEQEGRLRRSHGGAVSVRDAQPETPFAEREVTFAAQKRRIAAEAARQVRPRERILLDASSTAWYMARELPDMPLTVLTNSARVAVELAAKEQIQVICTGGQLSRASLSFVGPSAERSLEEYHVDKAFLSCKGLHVERGLSESNELQARVKQQMLRMADEVVLLADASKIGLQSFTRFGSLEQVGRLVTDDRITAEAAQALRESGLAVVVV